MYIREAHPTDGWRMAANDKVGIAFRQPRTDLERIGLADKCCAALEMTMPLVVDTIDDRVAHAYSAMPDRLYVIDRDGKVAYQGGRGPFGFKAGELEQELILTLLDEQARTRKTTARLPLLSDAEAWKRLPAVRAGEQQPLPAWARLLAGPLPRTTARMLELDALHRTGNRLEARLRGLVRWAAADANGCEYARTLAAADLRRAGVPEADLPRRGTDPSRLSPAERAAVAFARKMMREAHAVTDAEVKQLLQFLGEERVVALVALLAHASFQDRIFLTTNVQVEPGGPLPPLTVQFTRLEAKAPARKTPPAPKATGSAKGSAGGAEWLGLQQGLDRQRARTGRIRVPSREEVLKRLGEKHPAAWQASILWSRVCYGFQPELTDAWFECAAEFRQETALEPVFQQSLFWIVTQAQQCFY